MKRNLQTRLEALEVRTPRSQDLFVVHDPDDGPDLFTVRGRYIDRAGLTALKADPEIKIILFEIKYDESPT